MLCTIPKRRGSASGSPLRPRERVGRVFAAPLGAGVGQRGQRGFAECSCGWRVNPVGRCGVVGRPSRRCPRQLRVERLADQDVLARGIEPACGGIRALFDPEARVMRTARVLRKVGSLALRRARRWHAPGRWPCHALTDGVERRVPVAGGRAGEERASHLHGFRDRNRFEDAFGLVGVACRRQEERHAVLAAGLSAGSGRCVGWLRR